MYMAVRQPHELRFIFSDYESQSVPGNVMATRYDRRCCCRVARRIHSESANLVSLRELLPTTSYQRRGKSEFCVYHLRG